MRVLHIGKYYPPFFGGIEKVNFDIVENLNNKNIQTDVLCFNHNKGGTLIEEKGYKIIRASLLAKKFSTPISFSIYKYLKSIHKNYDIIHLHVPNPIAGLALTFVPFKGKLVLHWHLDIVKQKLLKIVYKPLQSRLLKKAHTVIVTSLNYAQHSNDLKAYLDKCVIIPIGIDSSYLKENSSFRAALEEKYQGKKLVFTLGRLTYYKGHKYLVEAAKHIPNDCIIAIGGIGQLETEVKRQIEQLGLQEKVILLGKVPTEELAEYYRRADVFCLPSSERSEAFGIVLLEAMACKCALITTELGSGTSWINQHNETGLVVPAKDAKALGDAIRSLLEDDVRRNKMAKNAYNRFQNEFQLEQMVDRTIALYNDLYNKNS